MKIFGKRREHLVIETLSEYLSGRLPPGEVRHVEAHVETCTGCWDELDSLRNTVGLMRRVPMVAPRTTFTLSEAPVEASSQGRVSWLPGWSYGAAASVAVMVFALVLSADVAGLLADDVAAPAPASGTPAEDTAAFAPEAPAAAPVPEGAIEGAERTMVLENEGVEPPVAAPPVEAREAQRVDDLAEEEAAPPGIAEAAVAQPLEKATEPEAAAAPALAAPAPAITEAPVAESAAPVAVEILPFAAPDGSEEAAETEPAAVAVMEDEAPTTAAPVAEEIVAPAEADGSEEAAETEPAAVAAMEDEAPVTAPLGFAEPDAPAAAPVSEPAPGPQVTPLMVTRETTSVLWRVLEGFAGGLAVAIIAVFLWMNRRQRRLSA